MKALLPLLLLALLPFSSSCSEATAAAPQKPKAAKPDVTYTGKIGEWGMAQNGAVYVQLTGTNMKGKEGTIWFKAEPSKNAAIGIAAFTVIMSCRIILPTVRSRIQPISAALRMVSPRRCSRQVANE